LFKILKELFEKVIRKNISNEYFNRKPILRSLYKYTIICSFIYFKEIISDYILVIIRRIVYHD